MWVVLTILIQAFSLSILLIKQLALLSCSSVPHRLTKYIFLPHCITPKIPNNWEHRRSRRLHVVFQNHRHIGTTGKGNLHVICICFNFGKIGRSILLQQHLSQWSLTDKQREDKNKIVKRSNASYPDQMVIKAILIHACSSFVGKSQCPWSHSSRCTSTYMSVTVQCSDFKK